MIVAKTLLLLSLAIAVSAQPYMDFIDKYRDFNAQFTSCVDFWLQELSEMRENYIEHTIEDALEYYCPMCDHNNSTSTAHNSTSSSHSNHTHSSHNHNSTNSTEWFSYEIEDLDLEVEEENQEDKLCAKDCIWVLFYLYHR